MGKLIIKENHPKVTLFNNHLFTDERGRFLKVFSTEVAKFNIEQINQVESDKKYTLRGLHYQAGKFAEAKIFKVMNGKIQLAYIDLRPNSPTYRKSGSIVLSELEESLYIPRGFATGYLTLNKSVSVLYLSDNKYAPKYENGLRWNDPILKIKWHTSKPSISDKDNSWKNWNA